METDCDPVCVHYKNPLFFNRYVGSMPEDFRRVMFERVLFTNWEGEREKPVADTTGRFVADLSVTNGARVLPVFL